VSETLIVAEHLQGAVRDVTAELVTAARQLGNPVAVAVIAREPSQLDVSFEGVDEVIGVSVEHEEFENDVYQAALEALIAERQPQVVMLGFTVNSMGYGPAVAGKLGLGFASDVHGLAREGEAVVATRSFYGGKVDAELEFPEGGPVLLLIRPTAFAPAPRGASPSTSGFSVEIPASRARHVDFREAAVGDVDITTADFLLSIGRGIGEQDAVPQFERLAEKLGAVLSVSRPLVDAGWMPNARQVGQSGKTVKPKVYLALGISGAVQHLAGMKTSGTIIAVNTDPEAAIFNVAHFGAVADLFDVADELEKLS
jgi:electron transfer flavoprotein alpha subunit